MTCRVAAVLPTAMRTAGEGWRDELPGGGVNSEHREGSNPGSISRNLYEAYTIGFPVIAHHRLAMHVSDQAANVVTRYRP